MNETDNTPTPTQEVAVGFDPANWKTKILAFGALVGALVGIGTAYLLTQNYERRGTQPEIGAREGVKLALLILGTVRSIASLGEGK